MKISEIWPIAEVEARVGVKVSVNETSGYHKISEKKKGSVFELGATVWDRYVSSTECIHDPMHFAKYFKNGSPGLLRAIEKLLNRQLLENIYYGKAAVVDKTLKYKTASELLVCELWPGTLHISDVEFSNPYVPVESGARLPMQKYKGLGLLPELLARSEQYCNVRGLNGISLTAATMDHFEYFKKFGFLAAKTKTGVAALHVGSGIPMCRSI